MRMSHRRSLYGGGIPPVPASWAAHAVVASTGSWSPDTAGWYRFYVIGQGGNGGNGTLVSTNSQGGGGGGTGGVAVHQLYLTPGNSVSISVSAASTSLTYGGETVTAGAGDNGADALYYGQAAAGGAGGSASGGNVSNLTGGSGEDGQMVARPTVAYGGAGGAATSAMKYVESAARTTSGDGGAAPYSTSASAPQLGGGGAGGAGASTSPSTAGDGGAGAAGGVVIEAGA